jgi:hypothetical protein
LFFAQVSRDRLLFLIATSNALRTTACVRPPERLPLRSRSGVGLSLLGCGFLGSGYPLIGESIEPVRREAWAGVALDVSGLQQFID